MNIPQLAKIKFVFAQKEIEQFKANLKPGSLISGRVMEAFGNDQYLVSLRGMNLVANSNLPLKKSDRFQAQVESTEPRLLLKIINSQSETSDIIDKWGIKGEAQKLIAEMSSAHLPVTQENFKRLNALANKFARHPKLNANYAEIARALVRLEKQHLPASLENISRQLTLQKRDFDLSAVLGKLLTLLKTDTLGFPPEVLNFAKNLPNLFSPQTITQNLPAILILMGLFHEASLKNLLAPGESKQDINLKWPLLLLLNQGGEEGEEALSLLNDLEALQMLNLPENRDHPSGELYYLQIPVYDGEKWSKIDLYLNSEPGPGGKLDRNNVAIHINLDTKFLGPVSTFALIQDGAVSAHLYFQQPEIADFVRPYASELEKGLADMGFMVKSISVSTLKDDDQFNLMLVPASPASENLNLVV